MKLAAAHDLRNFPCDLLRDILPPREDFICHDEDPMAANERRRCGHRLTGALIAKVRAATTNVQSVMARA